MTERVTCKVCQNRYVGRVPKGGDGSVLFPRKHNMSIPVTNNLGITDLPERKVVCPGSYEVAKEYCEATHD